MKRLAIFIFLITLILPFSGHSQYFSTGQDPARIKWRQINTVHFQLIFPENYEAKAQQLAYVFDKVYEYGYQTLNHPPRKISVILHTHTVNSNGLVAWSPKRMELFTTPHQAIYSQDWLEQLAIHEFRHVVQMDKIQQELPDILPVLFGEQAAAAVVGAYLPFWFIEGDAVVTETAFSKAGRGRLASFLMENKAQVVQKGLYSFNKASLGSYKDFVPNRYKFGYWMVGGTRAKYGAEIWTDVLDEIAQRPLSISPVNRVLKKKTGFTQRGLYQNLFQEYKKQWSYEGENLDLTPIEVITEPSKFYSNYTQAFTINDSTFIALKENRSDLSRIVKVTPSEEQIIYTPGSILKESFSGRDNFLIWSERRPDIRWAHADFSVIVVYNILNQTKREYRSENMLFSPVISPSKKQFAAVEVDNTSRYYLSIFDLYSGKRLQQFSLTDNQYVLTPCWDGVGEKIFCVALSPKGKNLMSVGLNDGKIQTLLEGKYHEIRNPVYADNNLYFTGSFTGIDNIYCYHLNNTLTEQLSSVPFGADYAFAFDNHILFSNYTAEGYELALLDTNDAINKPLNDIKMEEYRLAEALTGQEAKVLDFSGKKEAAYPTKPYRKLEHIFNFHSWAPAYIDVYDYDVKPGVSLFSQNKLGTAETRLGYEYDWEEEAGKYILGFKYSGFFPVFDTELTYGKRNSEYWLIHNTVDQHGNVVDRDTTLQEFSYNELNFDGSIYLPLYFSSGKFSQYVRPQVEYSYKNISHTTSTPHEFYSGYYHSVTYDLYLQNSLAKAELDLIPRWAQILDLTFRDGLKGGSDVGHLSAVQGYLFFPGLKRNHGIKIYNGYQTKESGSSFAFSNVIRFPRGYHSFQNTELYTLGFDYMMPLFYPDLSIGRLVYLKRVRASLFYDYGYAEGNIYSQDGEIAETFETNMDAVGVELLGDAHFLRLITPSAVGVRCAYHPGSQNIYLQILFSISLDSL